MGTKVKDFITKRFGEEQITDLDKTEEIDFYSYMICKMQELAEYAGIDTENFDDNFFVSEIHNYSKFGDNTICLYAYNKIGEIFNLVFFRSHPNKTICLVSSSTCQINLKTGSFIYNVFDKPEHIRYEVNIIHQKMSGILPYHIFDPKVTDNITTGVIEKDFNESSLAHNCVYEIQDTIEKSKNKKEYIDNDDFMWEVNANYSLEDTLKYRWPDLYCIIKDMPLDEAKKIVLENPSKIKDISSLLYLLELSDYKKRYDEQYKKRITKITK